MTQLTICIIIFVISLIMYATNILPMAVTSLLTMMAFVLTGCLDASTALGAFANTNTIIIGSMFVVAAGFNRTQFVDKLSHSIVKLAAGSFRRAWLGYVLLAVLLTNFIPSPMAVFAIVFPLVSSMCKEFQISPSKLMFGLAVVCISCCGILPFGSAISMAVKNNGFFETYGLSQYTMLVTDSLKGRWPVIFAVIAWAYFILPKIGLDTPPVPIVGAALGKKSTKEPLNPFSEICGYTIFFGVILLMTFSSQLKLPLWQICIIGAILMVVTGVLKGKEATSSIPLSIIFIYVGALATGNALTSTGAGTAVGEWLAKVVGNTTNSYVLGGLFFLIPFILTQFMLNQGVSNVFTPICLLTCAALGANPIGPMLLVGAGSLTAFMTPMATPAIPMAMGAGGYDLKSLFKQGWLISLILAIVNIFYVMTVFPAF